MYEMAQGIISHINNELQFLRSGRKISVLFEKIKHMLFKRCYWSVFRLQYTKSRNQCQDGSLQNGFQSLLMLVCGVLKDLKS